MKAEARRADWACAALLAAAWVSLFVYVDPRGDFPLNDDFIYAASARGLAETGVLRLSEWAKAAGLPHIALGALVARAGGAGNGALRLSMLVVGLAAAVLLFFILRGAGVGRGRALAGAGALAACPLYAAMSASFHTDVTCLLLSLLSLAALLRGLRDGGLGALAAGSALAGLAFLTRQSALLSLAGALVFLWRERRLTPRTAAALLLPAGVVVAAYLWWFYFIHGVTWGWLSDHQAPRLAGLRSAAAWAGYAARLSHGAQTLALFLLPLSLGLLSSRDRARPRGREWVVFGALVAGWAAGLAWSGGQPLLPNTLHRGGLGVVTLNEAAQKYAGAWGDARLWRALDLAGLLSSLLLARILLSRPWTADARVAVWLAAPPLLASLALPVAYDRYLLIALPAAILAVLRCGRERPFRPAAAAAGCLLAAAATGVGLKDYFAWNRARWEAGMAAVARGMPPEKIENGFDWDGQFTLERNMKALLASRPAREIGAWDWMALNRVTLATSFSPEPPPGFVHVASFPYDTPLSARPRHVHLHSASSASPRSTPSSAK